MDIVDIHGLRDNIVRIILFITYDDNYSLKSYSLYYSPGDGSVRGVRNGEHMISEFMDNILNPKHINGRDRTDSKVEKEIG
jgi:PhoPQ-activated pathogenicity-related protein